MSAPAERLARFVAARRPVLVAATAAPTLWLTGRLLTRPGHPVVDGCSGAPADFCVFWGAARLAWSGQPLSAFDPAALAQASGNLDQGWFPFLHPPGALFLVSPLGALSAPVAWLVFTALSVLALAFALWRLAPGHRSVRVDALLAPALLPALILGQMTLLWMAGFVLAFLALRDGQRLRAGLLIGALTLKPTLGLLLPVALLAAAEGRVILIAGLTALALHGVPTLVYGLDYWPLLAEVYGAHTARVLESLPQLGRMASLPAALTQLGIGTPAALSAQSVLTVALALAVFVVWRGSARFDRKMALLAAAVPLATPYLWYYDGAMTLIAGLFLLRAGLLPGDGAGAWLPLWIGPGAMLWFGLLAPGWGMPSAAVVWPLLVAALALAMRPPPTGGSQFSDAQESREC